MINFTRHKMFYTPVWEGMIEDSRQLNTMLIRDGIDFTRIGDAHANFSEFEGFGIGKLTSHVRDAVDEMGKEFNWPKHVTEIRSRPNAIEPLKCDTPHHHPYVDLVGVYYAKVPENSGDLLVLDPRGSVNIMWQDPNIYVPDTGQNSRVYYRITPKPGMLVLFPSYVFHSVETNFSNDTRISIVFEIKVNVDASYARD